MSCCEKMVNSMLPLGHCPKVHPIIYNGTHLIFHVMLCIRRREKSYLAYCKSLDEPWVTWKSWETFNTIQVGWNTKEYYFYEKMTSYSSTFYAENNPQDFCTRMISMISFIVPKAFVRFLKDVTTCRRHGGSKKQQVLEKYRLQRERINLSSIQHEVSVKWSDECGSHYSTYARIEFFLIRVTRVTARSKDQAKH